MALLSRGHFAIVSSAASTPSINVITEVPPSAKNNSDVAHGGDGAQPPQDNGATHAVAPMPMLGTTLRPMEGIQESSS
jgi:hypothetical protein